MENYIETVRKAETVFKDKEGTVKIIVPTETVKVETKNKTEKKRRRA